MPANNNLVTAGALDSPRPNREIVADPLSEDFRPDDPWWSVPERFAALRDNLSIEIDRVFAGWAIDEIDRTKPSQAT